LGGQCVADLLAKLAEAHLDLCRGQGAELAWPKRRANQLRAIDVLEIYALKTAPAFEVAFYSGLRMAGVECDRTVLRRFSACLGEAFQISNDLDDWRIDDRNKRAQGLDVLGERPTILRALAAEAGADTLADVLTQAAALPPAQAVDRVRQAYLQSGAFDKAQKLYGRLRQRALDDAGRFPTPQLQDLMRFLVRMMLPTEDRIDARPRR
jgi:geranylgeranyl pyrophosphate synthase